MARQFTASSTEYATGPTNAVLTAYPFACSCWVLVDSLDSPLTYMGISDVSDIGGGNARFQFTKTGDDNFQYFIDNGPSAGGTLFGATDFVSTGTWYHVMCWSNSATDHNIDVDDSGSPATFSTNLTFPAIDRVSIGRLENFGGVNYFDGRIAEVGIWGDTIPTADQMSALALGYSPSHFTDGLKSYHPLFGDLDPETAYFGTDHLTLTNTPTKGVHPPGIIYPHHTRIGHAASTAPAAGRIMSSLVGSGGLAGQGGIAGQGGGLAA